MVVRRGSVASGCLTILLLLALLLFVGIHVGGPYYRYYQFRDAAKQEARFGTMHTDDMIRKSLLAQADSLGLPEEAYFIRIQRTQRAIRIQSSYGDSWTIGSYTRPVHFDLDIQDTL